MIGNQRNFAAALVVPNFERPREVGARAAAIAFGTREELVTRARGGGALRRRRSRELTNDLAQFEQIKKVALLPQRVLASRRAS